jgi:glycerate dehydrogenase
MYTVGMTRPKILALDGATLNPGDNPWGAIARLGDFLVYDRTLPEQVIERSLGAAVLIINKVRLSAEVLEALPDLKLVAVTATGFDCVDAAAARDLGIAVCNVPTYGTDSVAQHVIALILHHCHRIDLHDAAVHDGAWCRSPDFCFWNTQLVELAGKALGIVGFGQIGRRVGELGHAFGMRVIAESRSRRNPPEWEGFQWASLGEVFATADFLSLHCPLTDATLGMVNAATLAQMKPTAVLINTSRGGLIVEQDLAEALNAGQIAGAALDVLSTEPPSPANPLLTAKNCVITPHHAWATLEARQRLMQTTAENVAAFLAGRPQNIVNGV